jgi:hypothetical protein
MSRRDTSGHEERNFWFDQQAVGLLFNNQDGGKHLRAYALQTEDMLTRSMFMV